ncbi:tyrosine-type recombinase/integrase [Sphingomonas aerolata]|uniref:tyrosine-type recombinase/integrase n=1 Tax=Sphingomonas aerolata TaxID=185951 RepID=UPI00208DF48C|nr:site-specific integrase [Sphingomonas aerolata]USQ99513.1 site-specific integrase [Sphingomonas aerolata]
MAIYPDKKDGNLTGRFRVELQQAGKRYRKRWDSLAEAKKDEAAVLATWAKGEAVDAATHAPQAPEAHTLASTIPKARLSLWQDIKKPETAWAHVQFVTDTLGVNTKLDAIDTLAIDKVIASLKKQGKTDATINRYLSHFRTFLVWCKARKYRTVPIRDEIEFGWRKESEGRIRWITPKEEIGIRDYLLSRNRPEANAVWDLIKVALETGCRREELLTSELEQINGTRLHLWETKTDTPRTVPMTKETTALLANLIKTGRMPSERGLRSWWERAREHLGLLGDPQFVFHVCRHTRATRMVEAGINVFVIKKWMGHKRIETTLRYAHVKDENLEDALVKVGDHFLTLVENPQKTAGFASPPTLPTSGEIEGFRMAA